ncbi:FliM/FliN family flagellar motor C-terminal domain-containing protein [Qipengyuania qiaonensis]|uniref:FliM/FliN family flagellar motor C-terminal domain-containing protein n=1 Tax=Qipengyuania qiaonensis TaxID=2867240 RepID=A0ABS7J3H7_9SPHN|nr:FliM/FliN family flagellar motor C-terminal domain-containing protein [Qipengyuania qiaonensis]MBX7481880.1 FliM/FliN family flagellar motor C-terminal domain-containing protein [Qipengyuania qiaonensis]
MISTPIPEAAARAACHCDELLSRAATPPELDIEFARFARGVAEQARGQLSTLCDDRGLDAEIVDTELMPVADWFAEVGTAHRHSFYSMGQESRGILISVRIGELVGQFERILGGTGEVDERCTVLPASAKRFAQQFEDRMADVLRNTSDRRGIAATAHGEEVEQVAPFAPGERVWTATLSITSTKTARAWRVRFAACHSTIADIVGTRAVSPATGRTIGARGIDGSAIAEVDLPLRAVLVDVPMSIARLASLEPGAVIPVAVNRNVPLMTGNLTIAHGCVGELDDRVALELTQTFLSE